VKSSDSIPLETPKPVVSDRLKPLFVALIAGLMSSCGDLYPHGEFELKSMISLEKKAKKY
jgi:hypothetical protein